MPDFDDIEPIYPKEKPMRFWESVGYAIREMSEKNSESLLVAGVSTLFVGVISLSLLFFHVVDELNVVEEIHARNQGIQSLMEKGVNPALAQCILDENYGDVCKALRTNELKPYDRRKFP